MNPRVKHRYNAPHKKWIVPEGPGYKLVLSFKKPSGAICEAMDHITEEMQPYLVLDESSKNVFVDEKFYEDKETGNLRSFPRPVPPPHPEGEHSITKHLEVKTEYVDREVIVQKEVPVIKEVKNQVPVYVYSEKVVTKEIHEMRKWVVPSNTGFGLVESREKPQNAFCEAPINFTKEMEPFLKLNQTESGGQKVWYVTVDQEHEKAKHEEDLTKKIAMQPQIENLPKLLLQKRYDQFHNQCNPFQRFVYSLVGPRVHDPKPHPFFKLIFGNKKLEGFILGGEYDY